MTRRAGRPRSARGGAHPPRGSAAVLRAGVLRADVLVAAALALVLAGCSSAGGSSDAQSAPRAPVAALSPSASPSAAGAQTLHSPRELTPGGVPLRLRVPALGIDAPVGPVGTAPDGSVEVPARWGDVGWFDGGARPGQPGPTVLLGHIDSTNGPAVFVRLPQARPGTLLEVEGADGSRHRYRVRRVAEYPKTRFPTEAVYLPVLRPELRLVTCGGSFDRSTGHYRDNIIAYADPVD